MWSRTVRCGLMESDVVIKSIAVLGVVTSARPTPCRWSYRQPAPRHSATATEARAWNDLPSMIRASSSLLTFRQRLKTVLVKLFDWNANERFCNPYYVKCPCNIAKC